jgi:Polyketide cyclase / dehydrase and lipid transport
VVRIEGAIAINRPVGEVFDFVADERNEPRYNPRILRVEQLTPGPMGRGTRFRAETRAMGRRTAIAIRYTDFERPWRLASAIQMSAADISGTLTFEPVAGGTRMRWSWDLRPRGWYRLLTPLIARLGRRLEQATWAGLKRFLEDQRDQTPQPR